MKLSKTDLEVVYAFKGYMFCAGNEYLDLARLPTTIITGSELWTIGSQPFWVISRSTRNIPPWGRGRLSVTRSSTFCCKDSPSSCPRLGTRDDPYGTNKQQWQAERGKHLWIPQQLRGTTIKPTTVQCHLNLNLETCR